MYRSQLYPIEPALLRVRHYQLPNRAFTISLINASGLKHVLGVEFCIRATMYSDCLLIDNKPQAIEQRSSVSPVNSIIRICAERVGYHRMEFSIGMKAIRSILVPDPYSKANWSMIFLNQDVDLNLLLLLNSETVRICDVLGTPTTYVGLIWHVHDALPCFCRVGYFVRTYVNFQLCQWPIISASELVLVLQHSCGINMPFCSPV